MFENIILPILKLEAIPRFWNKTVPTDYPKTTSEFSLKFEPEAKAAVVEFENKLFTEESAITPEMIPENATLNAGSYVGTYDVTGEAGVKTLLSPEKISSANVVGVLAMHYNTESAAWEKVEDAEIVDGYVYGTLESFSPVAILTLKRDTYVVETTPYTSGKTFVANGVAITISTNEEGKTIVTDSNGKVTEIDATTTVVGGTIDGTDIESTSIFVNHASVHHIYGGSFYAEDETGATHVKVGTVNVTVVGSTIKKGVVGTGIYSRANQVNISIKDSTVNFTSPVESYWTAKRKDTNSPKNLGFGSNTWTKNAKIELVDSKVQIAYGGGNSGYSYTDNVEFTISGGTYGWVTAGGSNGRTRKAKMSISDASANVIQSVNRGTVDEAEVIVNNVKCPVVAILGDPTDSSVNGTINSVKFTVSGDAEAKITAGTQTGVAATNEVVKEVVEYVKIGRDANVTFIDNADAVLGDLLRFK